MECQGQFWNHCFIHSLRQQPIFLRLHNDCRNSILMTWHCPDLGRDSDWLKICVTNQRHYPFLGSDTSDISMEFLQPRPQGFSLKKWVGRPTHFLREKPWGRGWNFYIRFSDVTLWGHQWWRPKMSAIFSGYSIQSQRHFLPARCGMCEKKVSK